MAVRRHKRTRAKRRAATADVLGTVAPKKRIPSKWRKYYDRLVGLRDLLLNRHAGLTKDAVEEPPNFSSHMADAGTDTYDRDFALGMLSSEQDALYEIDQALTRIQDGTYGRCELTGKKIEMRRLEAIPWARFTAAAEKQLEREGALKRTRLGPRDTVAKAEATAESEEE